MDVSPISNSAALAAEARKRAQGNRPEQREDAQLGERGAQKRAPSKLLDIYDTRRINRNLLRDHHGLNARKAKELLNDLSGLIARSSPWSLAELQPVAHRRLIPSAYV